MLAASCARTTHPAAPTPCAAVANARRAYMQACDGRCADRAADALPPTTPFGCPQFSPSAMPGASCARTTRPPTDMPTRCAASTIGDQLRAAEPTTTTPAPVPKYVDPPQPSLPKPRPPKPVRVPHSALISDHSLPPPRLTYDSWTPLRERAHGPLPTGVLYHHDGCRARIAQTWDLREKSVLGFCGGYF